MTPLDRFGGLTADAVEARSAREGTGTGARQRLDIRLVMIGHDLVGRRTIALDGLPKRFQH